MRLLQLDRNWHPKELVKPVYRGWRSLLYLPRSANVRTLFSDRVGLRLVENQSLSKDLWLRSAIDRLSMDTRVISQSVKGLTNEGYVSKLLFVDGSTSKRSFKLTRSFGRRRHGACGLRNDHPFIGKGSNAHAGSGLCSRRAERVNLFRMEVRKSKGVCRVMDCECDLNVTVII
jgi:hypothetical protein